MKQISENDLYLVVCEDELTEDLSLNLSSWCLTSHESAKKDAVYCNIHFLMFDMARAFQ